MLCSETNASGGRHRPDRDLFYLTGVTEPGAVAVLRPDGEDGDFVLFVRIRSPEEERWSGERLGPERAREVFGADTTYGSDVLSEHLPKLLAEARGDVLPDRDRVSPAELGARGPTNGSPARRQKGCRAPRDHRSRAVAGSPTAHKTAGRVGLHAASCVYHGRGIYRDARSRAARGRRVGARGILDGAFRRKGARGTAYPTIVGSGANACVLHYVDNDRTMRDGDLVLVDAGAEADLYVSDVTRTFPVSGSFTAAQRAIYDLVLEAHDRAIEGIRPGVTVERVHHTARDVLVDGLLDLGVLDGDRAEVIDTEAYKSFFPHQTSHWLGLEVHDVGDYVASGVSRVLEPGMVLTVEPGLYFQGPLEDSAVAEKEDPRGCGRRGSRGCGRIFGYRDQDRRRCGRDGRRA